MKYKKQMFKRSIQKHVFSLVAVMFLSFCSLFPMKAQSDSIINKAGQNTVNRQDTITVKESKENSDSRLWLCLNFPAVIKRS